jgi:hypothetical protein
MAQDFAPPAADVEDAHACLHVGDFEGIVQATRQVLALRF